MSRLIASAFGLGYLRPAPGTWGSAGAIPMAWALHALGGPILLALGILLAAVVGWWATKTATAGGGESDPSWIVIDEVAGQWIALLPVSAGAAAADVPVTFLWPGVLTAFLAFRLFDVWKPGPVGWADRLKGPTGVMLDDLIAGVMAAIVVIGLAWLAHAGFVAAVPDQP